LCIHKKSDFKCIYCYEKANTREHIPSKIFLNEPYSNNLAILPACFNCNNSYSENEQYLVTPEKPNMINYKFFTELTEEEVKKFYVIFHQR